MEKSFTAWQQFLLGIKTYKKAFSFIVEYKLWGYFIYPLVISTLLFYLSLNITESLAKHAEVFLRSFIRIETDSSWLQSILNAFDYLLSLGIRLFFVIIGYIISSYMTLIIMSPIMALISERTEEIMRGKKFPFNLNQFLKDVLRGILIALRNIIIEMFLTILLFVFSFVPLIGLGSSFFLIVISYYFYGFSLIDYSSERHQLNVKQSIKFIKANKGLAIGNGMIFSLLLKIPILGTIVAPVLGPVAATIAVMEIKGQAKGNLVIIKL